MAVAVQFNNALVERGEVLWDVIDPDIEIVDHDIPDAGTYHGHAGMTKWIMEDWGSAWESWEIGDTEVVEAGDLIVSVFTMIARGKGSGASARRRNATVSTVRNGLISRLEYYTTEQEARAAAGLEAATER